MEALARDVRTITAPRRGLRRDEAALYVGVSASKFDEWVRRGVMPKPKRQDGIVVWDRARLDVYFEAIPDGETLTPPSDEWGKG